MKAPSKGPSTVGVLRRSVILPQALILHNVVWLQQSWAVLYRNLRQYFHPVIFTLIFQASQAEGSEVAAHRTRRSAHRTRRSARFPSGALSVCTWKLKRWPRHPSRYRLNSWVSFVISEVNDLRCPEVVWHLLGRSEDNEKKTEDKEQPTKRMKSQQTEKEDWIFWYLGCEAFFFVNLYLNQVGLIDIQHLFHKRGQDGSIRIIL